ncbi:hypothetical protein RHD99_13600 [Buttiauxella selenatireducens]|uniref:Uncharacterized protein n=1 Tax=Buttiauxella selenatireducens TaxID=3073902 RepID=A0ABY9S4U5_9ENTR|nr:hypothetical protein [Buttiauxella sp. R73]WMY72520.1 hypothetical protein RHD99_13600 [Buttiauxella sp. R73]
MRYHNTAIRTLQVATLNSSLMFCIKDISQREEDHLKVYLDDLTDIAWDIALTLSACVEDSLGDDDSMPTICSARRGEISRQH